MALLPPAHPAPSSRQRVAQCLAAPSPDGHPAGWTPEALARATGLAVHTVRGRLNEGQSEADGGWAAATAVGRGLAARQQRWRPGPAHAAALAARPPAAAVASAPGAAQPPAAAAAQQQQLPGRGGDENRVPGGGGCGPGSGAKRPRTDAANANSEPAACGRAVELQLRADCARLGDELERARRRGAAAAAAAAADADRGAAERARLRARVAQLEQAAAAAARLLA